MEGPGGWPPGSGRPDQPPAPAPPPFAGGDRPAPPPSPPAYPSPAPFPGPYGPPGAPGYPGSPQYPTLPGPPGYGSPAQPTYPGRRPWHRRPILYVAVALIALLAGVAVFFVITSSPPITADEKNLVGRCVTVTGNAVRLVDCGKAHDGRITAVAQHYGLCPGGTSAFRIHSGVSNDHSACFVGDVAGAP